jgi:hypothetical protein
MRYIEGEPSRRHLGNSSRAGFLPSTDYCTGGAIMGATFWKIAASAPIAGSFAATLALALLRATPAEADDVAIRVMTQNVYQGTNFDELFAAQTPAEFVAAVTTTYNNILATDPAARAQAVANEIATQQPDIVSLQEVSTLLTGNPATTVQVDYLSSLQSDLKALGQNYAVVATLPELNAEAPSTLGYDVRLATRDAILVRVADNATLANIQVNHYADSPPLSSAIGPIPDPSGYASVDVTIKGRHSD